jgi:hypothetical protein
MAVLKASIMELEMRNRSRRLKALVSVAGIAATCVLPVAATAAASGAIHFIGAIVAPPFGVAYAPATVPSTSTPTVLQAGSANGVRVRFDAPVGVDPASVTVQMVEKTGAPAPQTIAARFVDGAGHQVGPDADGNFRLGASGGTLSISPAAGAAKSGGEVAAVVISYE